MKASYKERSFPVKTGRGNIVVTVQPGQFIYGKYSASKELKMSASTIWKRMQKLKTIGNCNLESNHHYTLVTIINWNTYQQQHETSNLESNHQVTTIKPPSVPYNKVKKVNKVKNKTYTADFLSFWECYPKKIGKDAAWRAWKNRDGELPGIDFLIGKVANQKKCDQWCKDGGQFIPHPATWINQGRWDDDLKIKLQEEGPEADRILKTWYKGVEHGNKRV